MSTALAAVLLVAAGAGLGGLVYSRHLRSSGDDESSPEEHPLHCSGAAGAGHDCGADHQHDCCESRRIPASTFKLAYDGVDCKLDRYDASISEFSLDAYEVTVGRFRAFVDAGRGTRQSPPKAGAGKHPRVAHSGWNSSWNPFLAPDSAALRKALKCGGAATWTDTPGENEQRPINCLSWYEAFAFCAADGGRLPTEAEWNAAASGGDEQRVYPWSNPPTSTELDDRFAVFAQLRPAPVGSKSPLGDGRWGHADLSGNVWEWVLDATDSWAELLPTTGANVCSPAGLQGPCDDCAPLEGTDRILRSSGFGIPPKGVIASIRRASAPTDRHHVFGVRCARVRPTVDTPSMRVMPASAVVGTSAGAEHRPGQYGFGVGQVVPNNLPLRGFVKPTPTPDSMSTLALGEFLQAAHQNGLGEGEDSARALLLELGCAWSKESRERIEHTIPKLLAMAPAGTVDGLVLLVEGEHPGQGADTYNLIDLTRLLQVHSPATIDPSGNVSTLGFNRPRLLLINSATMRVEAELLESEPGPAFQKAWDRVAIAP